MLPLSLPLPAAAVAALQLRPLRAMPRMPLASLMPPLPPPGRNRHALGAHNFDLCACVPVCCVRVCLCACVFLCVCVFLTCAARALPRVRAPSAYPECILPLQLPLPPLPVLVPALLLFAAATAQERAAVSRPAPPAGGQRRRGAVQRPSPPGRQGRRGQAPRGPRLLGHRCVRRDGRGGHGGRGPRAGARRPQAAHGRPRAGRRLGGGPLQHPGPTRNRRPPCTDLGHVSPCSTTYRNARTRGALKGLGFGEKMRIPPPHTATRRFRDDSRRRILGPRRPLCCTLQVTTVLVHGVSTHGFERNSVEPMCATRKTSPWHSRASPTPNSGFPEIRKMSPNSPDHRNAGTWDFRTSIWRNIRACAAPICC